MRCEVDINLSRYYTPKIIKNDFPFTISHEYDISRFLRLTYYEYVHLIIQNGGFFSSFTYHCFKTRKECQDFIDEFIEPRLIINKLTE